MQRCVTNHSYFFLFKREGTSVCVYLAEIIFLLHNGIDSFFNEICKITRTGGTRQPVA
jgi:hypothetical protein